jgi:hypothetical protein
MLAMGNKTWGRWYAVLALVGLPTLARADAGIPMIAIVWPVAWALLIPVVLIEAAIMRVTLGSNWKLSLKISAFSNLFSTALGIPLAWLLTMIVGIVGMLVVPVEKMAWLNSGAPARILSSIVGASWIVPGAGSVYAQPQMLGSWMTLSLVFYWASVVSENRVVRRYFPMEQRPQVKHFCWVANGAVYVPIFIILGVWLALDLMTTRGQAYLPNDTATLIAPKSGNTLAVVGEPNGIKDDGDTSLVWVDATGNTLGTILKAKYGTFCGWDRAGTHAFVSKNVPGGGFIRSDCLMISASNGRLEAKSFSAALEAQGAFTKKSWKKDYESMYVDASGWKGDAVRIVVRADFPYDVTPHSMSNGNDSFVFLMDENGKVRAVPEETELSKIPNSRVSTVAEANKIFGKEH